LEIQLSLECYPPPLFHPIIITICLTWQHLFLFCCTSILQRLT
jgi:hypothetical protein